MNRTAPQPTSAAWIKEMVDVQVTGLSDKEIVHLALRLMLRVTAPDAIAALSFAGRRISDHAASHMTSFPQQVRTDAVYSEAALAARCAVIDTLTSSEGAAPTDFGIALALAHAVGDAGALCTAHDGLGQTDIAYLDATALAAYEGTLAAITHCAASAPVLRVV
tara:strand:+ start:23 stop:514 length:492 start_codon:yes stop_codon:yes gene_type:complete